MLEWLRSGWILELREPTDLFWIGGHGPCPKELATHRQLSAKVWNPDFYDLEATAPGQASWSVQVSRETLLTLLLSLLPSTSTKPPRLFVNWSLPPDKDAFFRAVAHIQSTIQEGHLKKAVPVVCARGYAAVTCRQEFLVQRLVHALGASRGTGLRVHGHWQDVDGMFSGVLGLTPEDLFRVSGHELTTMAVAGTLPVPAAASDEVVGHLQRELLDDPKELEEHRLVVEDLVQRLSDKTGSISGLVSHVEVGETEALRFRQLLHLVTPLRAQFAKHQSETARTLLHRLHPTPALGLAPRTVELSYLKEIDATLLPSPRAGFGAPFVVIGDEVTEAVVAIRQLRWKTESDFSDRLEVEILSGCGIVAASQPEKEWTELQAKRQSVGDALGLSREAPKPLAFASRVIRDLVSRGVRHFVVCAGARNAPLVVALDHWEKRSSVELVVESFFDERAASFYALGVSRSSGRPVAIVTTSGTAVTELHSAMAEADLSGVSLIALTADRPKRLRFSGAPQSLRQDAIFSYFTGGSVDVEEGDELPLPKEFATQTAHARPWHLNICFEEPLLADADSLSDFSFEAVEAETPIAGQPRGQTSDFDRDCATLIQSLRRRSQRGGMAIVGKLSFDEREPVRDFLLKTQMPCWLEGSSGLRGDEALRGLELCSGDRVLQRKILDGEIQQVLRFGGVPTTRVWRDLDDPGVSCVTTSISMSRFTGLGRGSHIAVTDAAALSKLLKSAWQSLVSEKINTSGSTHSAELQLLQADREAEQRLLALLAKLPQSEPAWVRALSEEMVDADLVYVGNSLPIRWWDWTASRKRPHAVEANRGVNGIDGQISTALGWMRGAGETPRREAWILIGDLTALYDLSGPWAMRFEELRNSWKVRIVVLNNSGGQIFRQVLKSAPSGSAPFENAHSLGFQEWSKMWGMDYRKLTRVVELEATRGALSSSCVLEVVPSEIETAQFWKELR